jgi:DNA-binding MarR family transcriptional regulator
MRRAAPPSFGPLTGSQVELLRLVRANPGISVTDTATRLRLAPNTVSTLVGSLVDAGMLVREQDRTDRRVARLRLTRPAARRVAAWRSHRVATVARAIDDLEPAERLQIQQGLPALVRLAQLLDRE